jgi:ribonuclease HI
LNAFEVQGKSPLENSQPANCTMTAAKPHFLLFCDGNSPASGESAARGRWKFVLENVETGEKSEATDIESGCAPDRCALISVLRGLESLEQPSRVTLITTSRYVSRGLQYGLVEWRDNDFSWEHFGAVQPIRNADIWKRIDRTLAYHQVQCRFMAQEESTSSCEELGMNLPEEPNPSSKSSHDNRSVVVAATRTSRVAPQSHVPANRSVLSNKASQRIFVDTPAPAAIEEAPISAPSDAPQNTFDSIKSPANAGPSKLGGDVLPGPSGSPGMLLSFFGPIKIFIAAICLPILLARRAQIHLCRQVWDAILTIDDWLDCFLRCLFLLEPRNRHVRR